MTWIRSMTLYCFLGMLHFSNSWINNEDFETYLNQYDGDYAEFGTSPPNMGKAVTGHITYRKNWHFAGFGEVPYLVIFYKRIYSKTSLDSYVKLTPGNYCGGMRITVMRFITSCRCLNSWYHWKVGAIAPVYRPWEKDPYDIDAKRIFVTTLGSEVVFEPDDRFELDTSDLGQCGHGQSPKIEAIVVKFSLVDKLQDTPHFEPEELLPWPPKPLPQLESQPGSKHLLLPDSALKGLLTSYGMKSMNWVGPVNVPILNDFGEKISVNTTATCVGVKEIPLQGDCLYNLNAKWKLLDDVIRREETANYSLVCFQVPQEIQKHVSVCGGAPGFPVLRDGTVHGLVVEPLDCDTGYVVTLSFDNALKVKIEDVIDPHLLNVAKVDKPGVEPKITDPLDSAYQYAYFWDLYNPKVLSRSSYESTPFWSVCIIVILTLYQWIF